MVRRISFPRLEYPFIVTEFAWFQRYHINILMYSDCLYLREIPLNRMILSIWYDGVHILHHLRHRLVSSNSLID